jgi:hypothetical protein
MEGFWFFGYNNGFDEVWLLEKNFDILLLLPFIWFIEFCVEDGFKIFLMGFEGYYYEWINIL